MCGMVCVFMCVEHSSSDSVVDPLASFEKSKAPKTKEEDESTKGEK